MYKNYLIIGGNSFSEKAGSFLYYVTMSCRIQGHVIKQHVGGFYNRSQKTKLQKAINELNAISKHCRLKHLTNKMEFVLEKNGIDTDSLRKYPRPKVRFSLTIYEDVITQTKFHMEDLVVGGSLHLHEMLYMFFIEQPDIAKDLLQQKQISKAVYDYFVHKTPIPKK